MATTEQLEEAVENLVSATDLEEAIEGVKEQIEEAVAGLASEDYVKEALKGVDPSGVDLSSVITTEDFNEYAPIRDLPMTFMNTGTLRVSDNKYIYQGTKFNTYRVAIPDNTTRLFIKQFSYKFTTYDGAIQGVFSTSENLPTEVNSNMEVPYALNPVVESVLDYEDYVIIEVPEGAKYFFYSTIANASEKGYYHSTVGEGYVKCVSGDIVDLEPIRTITKCFALTGNTSTSAFFCAYVYELPEGVNDFYTDIPTWNSSSGGNATYASVAFLSSADATSAIASSIIEIEKATTTNSSTIKSAGRPTRLHVESCPTRYVSIAWLNEATIGTNGIVPNNGEARWNTLPQVSYAKLNNTSTNHYEELVEFIKNNVGQVTETKSGGWYLAGEYEPYTCEYDLNEIVSFATSADIIDAYDALCVAHPTLLKRNEDIGMDATNTYVVPHYTLGRALPCYTKTRGGQGTSMYSEELYPPMRIAIESSIHGAERYSVVAVYLAMKTILENPNAKWAQFILNNCLLEITPCTNPWGYTNNNSNNANGYNLNRTFFKNVQQENTNIINFVNKYKNKGLVGMVSAHTTGGGNLSNTLPYFVARSDYKHIKDYVYVTGHISNILQDMGDALMTGKEAGTPVYALWDTSGEGTTGQLHEYLDSEGLLGGTFEIYNNQGDKGTIFEKAIVINTILEFIKIGARDYNK